MEVESGISLDLGGISGDNYTDIQGKGQEQESIIISEINTDNTNSRNSPQSLQISDQDSGLDMDMDNMDNLPSDKRIGKGTVSVVDPYADEPDETLSERLWGLTEMVPECVRNATHVAVTSTLSGVKSLYSFSRNVSWIIASSSVILLAPVILEVERVKVEEMQKNQQKQFLLGPSAAMVGPGGGVPTPPLPR